MQQREVGNVRLGKVQYSTDPGVQGSSEVVLMVHCTDNDGLEVYWVDIEREEGALDAKDVPASDLVATRHRVETLTSNDPIPSLKL